jgi:hypothetical protein
MIRTEVPPYEWRYLLSKKWPSQSKMIMLSDRGESKAEPWRAGQQNRSKHSKERKWEIALGRIDWFEI